MILALILVSLVFQNIHANERYYTKEVLAKLEIKCNKSDFDACLELARKSSPQDKQVLLKKACNGKNAKACFELDELNLHTRNPHRSEYLALQDPSYIGFYKQKCAENISSACSMVSYLERQKNNLAESKKYEQIACDKNDYASCMSLAFDETKGINELDEIKLYKKACDGKYYDACFYAGEFEARRNKLVEAKIYYQINCEADYYDTCKQRDSQITTGKFENYKGGKCATLISECDKTKFKACTKWGEIEEKIGNFEKANELYKISCKKDDGNSCYLLGLLEKKKGNLEASKKSLKVACTEGIIKACTLLPENERPSNAKKEEEDLLE